MAFSFGVFLLALGLSLGPWLWPWALVCAWSRLGHWFSLGFRLCLALAFGLRLLVLAFALGFALARHTGPETNRKEEAKLFELIGTNRN